MEEQTPVPGNSAGKSARLSDLCLVGGLLLLGLALMACLFLMDDTRDLPHVEAYKEKLCRPALGKRPGPQLPDTP